VKFFKFKRDKEEPKYKTMEMLEEFVGEDGIGMNLINDGKFSKAINYFDKMLRKYPRSVYFRAHKGMALCGLERFDEAVTYFDEIVEISDYWRNKYLPTFNDLSIVTCSTLLNKALVMEVLNRQGEDN
jgi:tetratricopeptide (TPR) repeat protein